ncbi:MAG: prenyltransferase/squalene oxidase repeat-containing protein [Lentisphaeria bacterium]|nr:prenyltransferase/squalene oxidase repeat-containing protein [Lentisphaeria bacterium]
MKTLRSGRRTLSPEGRRRISRFVLSNQGPGGGFRGPDGISEDTYYSWFGGALVTTGRHPRAFVTLRRFVGELSRRGAAPMSLPETAAWSALRRMTWLKRKNVDLSPFMTPGGGYSHLPGAVERPTSYGAYLARLAAESAGMDLPVTPLAEWEPASGASGLAAEILLIMLAGAPGDPAGRRRALLSLVDQAGGIRPHAAGTADALSTGAGLTALKVSGGVPEDLRTNMARFIEACWTDSGGFREAPDHGAPDVEYTFYALLGLGALT